MFALVLIQAHLHFQVIPVLLFAGSLQLIMVQAGHPLPTQIIRIHLITLPHLRSSEPLFKVAVAVFSFQIRSLLQLTH